MLPVTVKLAVEDSLDVMEWLGVKLIVRETLGDDVCDGVTVTLAVAIELADPLGLGVEDWLWVETSLED